MYLVKPEEVVNDSTGDELTAVVLLVDVSETGRPRVDRVKAAMSGANEVRMTCTKRTKTGMFLQNEGRALISKRKASGMPQVLERA